MNGQFHSPTVLIHCLGQTSLSDPSTFFRVLRIVAIVFSAAPTSQLYIVFAILTAGKSSSFCTRVGSWGCQKGARPGPAESSVCVALLPTSSFTPSPSRPHSPEYSPAATSTLCRDIRGSFELLPRSSHCCVSGRSLVHLGPGESRLGQSGNLGQCQRKGCRTRSASGLEQSSQVPLLGGHGSYLTPFSWPQAMCSLKTMAWLVVALVA